MTFRRIWRIYILTRHLAWLLAILLITRSFTAALHSALLLRTFLLPIALLFPITGPIAIIRIDQPRTHPYLPMVAATLLLNRLRRHSGSACAKTAITAQLLVVKAGAISLPTVPSLLLLKLMMLMLVVRRSAISVLDSWLPLVEMVCKPILCQCVTALFDASAKVETRWGSSNIVMVTIVAIVVTTTLISIFLAHNRLLYNNQLFYYYNINQMDLRLY